MRKFEDSLPLQLLKAREATMQFFRPLLLENSLSEQQWRVLRALYAYQELESKELANHCCLLSPSLTGILKRLQQQGYVQRRKSEEDQRRTIISLTDKGRALEEIAETIPEQMVCKMGIPVDELQILQGLCNKLLARIN